MIGISEQGLQELVAFLDVGALIPRAGPLQALDELEAVGSVIRLQLDGPAEVSVGTAAVVVDDGDA